MMKSDYGYEVLRGLDQIGGSVVEFITDTPLGTKRIWVDCGSELSPVGESTDRFIIDKLNNPEESPDAVFFTHIHGDHIGLLSYLLPTKAKVYMGRLSQLMLINIRETLVGSKREFEDKDRLMDELTLLKSDRVRNFEDKATVQLDDFGIEFTALSVDHSVLDSYMFKFKIRENVIVHTGDFRAHGRLGETLYEDVEKYIASKVVNGALVKEKINVLITEGTMMSRLGEEVFTEVELRRRAAEVLSNNKYVFLICSSTNADSICSFYNAMKDGNEKGKCPDRKFYCNKYYKSQLDIFTEFIGREKNREEFIFTDVETIDFRSRSKLERMKEDGFLMVVNKYDSYRKLMEKFRDVQPVMIYSMWNGYLEENKPYTDEDMRKTVMEWTHHKLHTSGHASADTIARIITIVDPQDVIQPIHTENPYGFYMLDIEDKYRDIIKIDDELLEKEIDTGKTKKRIKDFWTLPEKYDFSTGENDNRAFGEKTNMWKALQEGGVLRPYVDMVKNDPELELCFRGNTSGSVCVIYYNNNEFFRISLVNNKARLSFNMSHARYWDEIGNAIGECTDEDERKLKVRRRIDEIAKELQMVAKYEKNADSCRLVLKEDKSSYSEEDLALLKRIADRRKEMLISYFAPECDMDYYKGVQGKKSKLEKIEQQKLMRSNTECYTGYYIYDMEYAQAYGSDDLKRTYNLITGSLKQNKPDSLAIRFEKGEPKALVLVELKSTEAAMGEEHDGIKVGSGIIDHIHGMRNYVLNPLNQVFITRRKKEAFDIMRSYQKLGLHDCDASLDEDAFMKLDLEMLVVITGNTEDGVASAKDYYEDEANKSRIQRVAFSGKKKCGILVLKDNEFKLNPEEVDYVGR